MNEPSPLTTLPARALTIGAGALLLLASAACSPSGNETAAQELFDACTDSSGDLLRLDGSQVLLEVLGEDAADLAAGSEVSTDDVVEGQTDGLGVALSVMVGTECLVAASGYPGLVEQLADGETWDGWTFTEDPGTGAEFTLTFTAGPDATVSAGAVADAEPEPEPSLPALTQHEMTFEEIFYAIGCTDTYGNGHYSTTTFDFIDSGCINAEVEGDPFVMFVEIPDQAGEDNFETLKTALADFFWVVEGNGWAVLGTELDHVRLAAINLGGTATV